MSVKIVADSAANMHTLEGIDFASAPLTIRTADREFVDNASLDILEMVDYLGKYKGKSGSACPGVGDWLEVFGDADEVYCVTIISSLSGSYNAAMTAKAQYEEEHPGKKVFVLDSVSAGPEQKLLVEKLRDFILKGKEIVGYTKSELIWYIIIAECILYSGDKKFNKIGDMVKQGDIANMLIKPIDTVNYFIAETTDRKSVV